MQENYKVEFKSTLNEKLEKEVVAFLNNREGGTLYIGLDDEGHPVGHIDVDDVQLKIADRLSVWCCHLSRKSIVATQAMTPIMTPMAPIVFWH